MSGTIDLDSGTLVFGNAKTDKVHTFDLMVLQLTIEQLQGKHNLKADKDGFLQPTPDFLRELAGEMDALGFDGCSPTQAHQIWVTTSVAMVSLKKKLRQSLNSVTGITATPEPSAPPNGSATKPTSPGSKPKRESTKGK
jgi:hypothetical protein